MLILIFGSILIGAVLIVFVNRKSYYNPYILVIQCEDGKSETSVKKFIRRVVTRMEVKSKTVQRGMIELNLEIRLKGENTEFVNGLLEISGVKSQDMGAQTTDGDNWD